MTTFCFHAELHLYIFILEKCMNLNLGSLLLEIPWVSWVRANQVSDLFVIHRCSYNSTDNHPKHFLGKQNPFDGKNLWSMPLTSPSLLSCSSRRVNTKEENQQCHYVWKDLSHTVFRWKEREILGPIPATHLDLCQKCFITIYNNDSVDIFKVL